MTATPPVPTATSWTPDQWEGWREVVRRLATITTATTGHGSVVRDTQVRTLATAGAA